MKHIWNNSLMLSSSRWWRNSKRAHRRNRKLITRSRRTRVHSRRKRIRLLNSTRTSFKETVRSRSSCSSRWHRAPPNRLDNCFNLIVAWFLSWLVALGTYRYTRVKMYLRMAIQTNKMHKMSISMPMLELDPQLREEAEPISSKIIPVYLQRKSNTKARLISGNRKLWGSSNCTSDNVSKICIETSSTDLVALKDLILEEWLSRICWPMEEKQLCLQPNNHNLQRIRQLLEVVAHEEINPMSTRHSPPRTLQAWDLKILYRFNRFRQLQVLPTALLSKHNYKTKCWSNKIWGEAFNQGLPW